jgi:ribonuclease BN (tRNA processing enzyme)
MELKILGAHNCESRDTRLPCLLVDDVIAIDVGGLTSSLTFEQQERIKAILLTHHHFDHIRDLATFGMNAYMRGPTGVYAPQGVLDVVASYMLDGVLYIDYRQKPTPQRPALRLCPLQPGEEAEVEGYRVLPLPTNHSVPTVGYQLTAPDGRRLFYTGDTGRNPPSLWQAVSPDLLVTEVTITDNYADTAAETGHLTPQMLGEELADFRRVRGYLPPVVTVHMTPALEDAIRQEVAQVAAALGADITLGHEGMKITV